MTDSTSSDIDVEDIDDYHTHLLNFRAASSNVANGQGTKRKRKLRLEEYRYKREKRQERDGLDMNQVQVNAVTISNENNSNQLEAGVQTHNVQQGANGQYEDDISTDSFSDHDVVSEHYSAPDKDPPGRQPQHATPTYVENCLETITSGTFLQELLETLQEHDLLTHFMALLTTLHDKSLPPDNIAVLLCLERAFLQTKRSSTFMRYSDKSKQFWELIYRLGGGELIRLMSGPKHFDLVNQQKVPKSLYLPSLGKFNFAVPDERIIGKPSLDLRREIPPGLIHECFQLIDYDKEYVLSVDGKKISPG